MKQEKGFILLLVLAWLLLMALVATVFMRQSFVDAKTAHVLSQSPTLMPLADKPLQVLRDMQMTEASQLMAQDGWLASGIKSHNAAFGIKNCYQKNDAWLFAPASHLPGFLLSSEADEPGDCALDHKKAAVQLWVYIYPVDLEHYLVKQLDQDNKKAYRGLVYSLALKPKASELSAAKNCLALSMQNLQALHCLQEVGVAHEALAEEFLVLLDQEAGSDLSDFRYLRWYPVRLIKE